MSARPAMSRGHSTDAVSDLGSQPTTPQDSTVKRGLSAAELENKTLSILEEYLHICDIQVSRLCYHTASSSSLCLSGNVARGLVHCVDHLGDEVVVVQS